MHRKQGYVTKQALPNVSRSGTVTVSAQLLVGGEGASSGGSPLDNQIFVDSSVSAHTITPANNFTVLAGNNPFSLSTSGSLFNEQNYAAYLTIPYSTDFDFSGEFTIEAWIYPTTTMNGGQCIVTREYNGSDVAWAFGVGDGSGSLGSSGILSFGWYFGSWSYLTSSYVPPINQWTHVAVTRNASNLIQVFANGVVIASQTVSTSFSSSTNVFVARRWDLGGGGSSYYWGFISNLRIVNGTCVYPSAFTPPTAPLTAITNTVLLMSTDTAEVIDGASNTALATQIGTPPARAASPSKWGTGSLDYSTGGQELNPLEGNNGNVYFGAGDFTISAWVYPTDLTNINTIYSCWGGSGGQGFVFQFTPSGYLAITLSPDGYTSYLVIGTTQNVTINTWNYVNFVRSGSTLMMFVNGNMDATTGTFAGPVYDSSALSGNNNRIGLLFNGSSLTDYFYGYMNDLCVVNGYALYTSNFTPPTSPTSATFSAAGTVNNNQYGIYTLQEP